MCTRRWTSKGSRRLAQKEHSAALPQLASRVSPVMRCGPGAGEVSLAEEKELITHSSEARHKPYSEDESAKACERKVDPETQVATQSSKLEADVSKSREVAELNVDLGVQSAEQLKMDARRISKWALQTSLW